jgi:phosphohistidine phosphatase SixA
MHGRARLLGSLALTFTLLAPCAAFAEPTAIFIVRHAEKAAQGKDPDLTADGQARARNIAAMLHKAGITAIFSTPFARTRQTAQALAQRIGVEVQLYDPKAPAALADKVMAQHGAVLVVGHSNTVPELVRAMGGTAGADIPDTEYDRLYELVPTAGGVTTLLLTSLPESAPAH